MAWQILAMWAVVAVTLWWFIRDERRLRAEADLAEAARFYALAPRYRHITPEPLEPAAPALRPRGLSTAQRAFFTDMATRS